ncbi:MAG TPA: glycerophosphodiester phosphodiesterase [Rhodocyclaceae bacterium]|nr:glycerophosphodiester phosphodiesterase [Rhodocyclaceae bacterium]
MGVAADYPLPRWIAHRGGGALAPENTLAGFRLAARLGFQAVEFDVMLAADGVPVVIHDETLLRTTGQAGAVPDFSAAGLHAMDAGTCFHAAFAGEPLPAFAEVIAVCAECSLAANVEIKPAAGHEVATGQAVAKMVQAHWPAGLPVVLSSFDERALAAAAATAPMLPRALLFERIPDDWPRRMQAHQALALHCHHDQLTTANGLAVLAAGIPVAVYTVNRLDLAEACWRAGVAALFTDRLDIFPG